MSNSKAEALRTPYPAGRRIPLLRIFLCAAAVASVFVVARPPASAQVPPSALHEVEIGRFIKGLPAESMAFYPSSLKVHSGDVLHFTNEAGRVPESGIHGALALPAGSEPGAWEQENATNLDGEWAFFQTDPDDDAGDAPHALKGNWKTILPSDLTCGTAENPCVTGTSPAARAPFNSGLSFPLDFYLKIEADPGTRIWVICPTHTKMKMKVDVVADDEPATTPEESRAVNEAKLARDTAKAERLHRTFSQRRSSVQRKDGTRLWDAWAGIERGTVMLYKMYPRALTVDKGDAVKWHLEDARWEIHSVTFPLNEALDVHNAPWITLLCDPDTDAGVAPDVDPQGQPCPAPPSDAWEFDLHPRFYFPEGDGRLRGGEYESSGIRGALAGLPHRSFTMRFPQGSGLTEFDYGCQLHPTMRGGIKVR